MSNVVLSRKIVQARKTYNCDACEYFLESSFSINDLKKGDEKLILEAAIADKYKILPGQLYLRVTGIYEGGFYTFRARPGIDDICHEYDLYPED